MAAERADRHIDVWFFTLFVLLSSFLINWLQKMMGLPLSPSTALFTAGILAFVFQAYAQRKPLIELYSKNHPYRKLKPYGVISAFILFEFIIAWGLYTKQIRIAGRGLFLINGIFIGAIVYYHAFVRMKISLRFLFLAAFIPLTAAGAALGVGSYFKILEFVSPAKAIGLTVLFNTLYWIVFNLFIKMICEEPAFRGYIMQRLLDRGEPFAIICSSVIFTLWHVPFIIFSKIGLVHIFVISATNFLSGLIFGLLFVKGRNLLLAVLCHAIINGLYRSLFASYAHSGIREYIRFFTPGGEVQLLALWFGCLLIGLILLTFIPRKRLYAG